jgi:uncharacterized protein (DUF58 family)
VITGRLSPSTIAAAGRTERRWPISVGPRALWLLAMGLLMVVPAWFSLRLLWLLLLWDAAVALAWWIDLRRLPAPDDIVVERSWSAALALGVPSSVTIRVENRSRIPLLTFVQDVAPESMIAVAPELEIPVEPGSDAQGTYSVRPATRGDAAFGPAVVRYSTFLALATRWISAPIAQSVRVYPDFHQAHQHALRVVRSTRLEGSRRPRRLRGHGREFDALRDYRDGDDPRDICWTASARRGHAVTRVFQPERSQTVWIVIDGGRLTRGVSGALPKLDHSVNAALALAHVALQSGDRVGLLAYGARVQQRIVPGRGASHLRALVESLSLVQPELTEGGHLAAATAVRALQRSRALVVWLTEIAETAGVPDVIEGCQHLVPRHLAVLAVPRAMELTTLAARCPEGPADMYRVMAAQESADRREALLASLRQRGVLAMEWRPGELSGALVDQYLSIKTRNLL